MGATVWMKPEGHVGPSNWDASKQTLYACHKLPGRDRSGTGDSFANTCFVPETLIAFVALCTIL